MLLSSDNPDADLEPSSQEKIPWDDAFKQVMQETLLLLGLTVKADIKLGKLPLKADLVIIHSSDLEGEWRQHPLWRYCHTYNLVEFKSVNDPIVFGDLEVWFAYTLLYRKKYKLAYNQGLAAWLIVERMNKQLRQALTHYHLALTEILPGFWRSESLFPIYIVAYQDLPFELPYSVLKLFLKSGKAVQETFLSVLESEQREAWLRSVTTAMHLVHPQDAKEVLDIMSLAAERKLLKETAFAIVKEDVEQQVEKSKQEAKLEGKLEGQLETAQQMKADGLPVAMIAKYTGLSIQAIEAL